MNSRSSDSLARFCILTNRKGTISTYSPLGSFAGFPRSQVSDSLPCTSAKLDLVRSESWPITSAYKRSGTLSRNSSISNKLTEMPSTVTDANISLVSGRDKSLGSHAVDDTLEKVETLVASGSQVSLDPQDNPAPEGVWQHGGAATPQNLGKNSGFTVVDEVFITTDCIAYPYLNLPAPTVSSAKHQARPADDQFLGHKCSLVNSRADQHQQMSQQMVRVNETRTKSNPTGKTSSVRL
ncbi:unnamed protein product [Protopolystoma xenopodis]|uniref:Uncharacterized protein n=1 Tax=Protopolystoma xenopodis TaxID=117903 RepID=A0A448X7R8_9PLAT|nr:unnamed protein product [Protopolystoma xenopodis]